VAGAAVPGFLPSTHGFRFANDFPHVPLRSIGIPGVVSIPIGDASNGLCGGMAFAVRDYFEAGRTPPGDTTPPASGPLYDYLVGRLFDSFGLPLGPVRYLELMAPALSDGESVWSRIGWVPHGRAWRMVNEEWPKVRTDIDNGLLSPLGLVKVKSLDPMDLGQNHQVLAYAYELSGGRLTIRISDPNWAGRDDVTMQLSIADPTKPIAVTCSPSTTVWSFFRVPYTKSIPPA
jgi:hypothetical protein